MTCTVVVESTRSDFFAIILVFCNSNRSSNYIRCCTYVRLGGSSTLVDCRGPAPFYHFLVVIGGGIFASYGLATCQLFLHLPNSGVIPVAKRKHSWCAYNLIVQRTIFALSRIAGSDWRIQILSVRKDLKQQGSSDFFAASKSASVTSRSSTHVMAVETPIKSKEWCGYCCVTLEYF